MACHATTHGTSARSRVKAVALVWPPYRGASPRQGISRAAPPRPQQRPCRNRCDPRCHCQGCPPSHSVRSLAITPAGMSNSEHQGHSLQRGRLACLQHTAGQAPQAPTAATAPQLSGPAASRTARPAPTFPAAAGGALVPHGHVVGQLQPHDLDVILHWLPPAVNLAGMDEHPLCGRLEGALQAEGERRPRPAAA